MVSAAFATSSNIGFVIATGEIQVDGSLVRGNSTIFSGSVIASGSDVASLRFSDGTSAMMNPGSIVTVYTDRSVLQQGVTTQRGVDKHAVVADGLRISSVTPNAVALVGVKDASHFKVASQLGELNVSSDSGILMARVEPGDTLGFSIGQAAANQDQEVSFCGKLSGNHQLKDSITKVTYQLQGTNLDPFVGKWVDVTGTTLERNPSSTAPQVVTVSNITKLDHPCIAARTTVRVLSYGRIVALVAIAAAGVLIGVEAANPSSPQPVTPAVP
jgi:hypothetical protein